MHPFFETLPHAALSSGITYIAGNRWKFAREVVARNFIGRPAIRNMRVIEHMIKGYLNLRAVEGDHPDHAVAENKAFEIYNGMDISLGTADDVGELLQELVDIAKAAAGVGDEESHEYVEDAFKTLRREKERYFRKGNVEHPEFDAIFNKIYPLLLTKIVIYAQKHSIELKDLPPEAVAAINQIKHAAVKVQASVRANQTRNAYKTYIGCMHTLQKFEQASIALHSGQVTEGQALLASVPKERISELDKMQAASKRLKLI